MDGEGVLWKYLTSKWMEKNIGEEWNNRKVVATTQKLESMSQCIKVDEPRRIFQNGLSTWLDSLLDSVRNQRMH